MDHVILVYHMEQPRLKQFKARMKAMKVLVKRVPPIRYTEPVGRELGMELPAPRETYQGPEFRREMIVLCGLPDAMMEAVLRELRAMGTVELKAALTQTNSGWSGLKLYNNLCAEHDAIQQAEMPDP